MIVNESISLHNHENKKISCLCSIDASTIFYVEKHRGGCFYNIKDKKTTRIYFDDSLHDNFLLVGENLFLLGEHTNITINITSKSIRYLDRVDAVSCGALIISLANKVLIVDSSGKIIDFFQQLHGTHLSELKGDSISCISCLDSNTIIFGTTKGFIGSFSMTCIQDSIATKNINYKKNHSDKVTDIAVFNSCVYFSSRDKSISYVDRRNVFGEVKFIDANFDHFINKILVNDSFIVAGCASGTIYFLSSQYHSVVNEFSIHLDSIRSLLFIDREAMLLISSDDGAVSVFDCKKFIKTVNIELPANYNRSCAISLGRERLYVGTNCGDVFLMSSGASSVFCTGRSSSCRKLLLMNDHNLIIARDDGSIDIFNVETTDSCSFIISENSIYSICKVSDKIVAFGDKCGQIIYFDMEVNRNIFIFKPHKSIVGDIVCFEGKLISCSDDGTIQIHHVMSSKLLRIVSPDINALNNIVLSLGCVFVSSDKGSVVILDVASLDYSICKVVDNIPLRSLCLYGEDKVIVGARDGSVFVLSVVNMDQVYKAKLKSRIVDIIQFGNGFVVCSEDEVKQFIVKDKLGIDAFRHIPRGNNCTYSNHFCNMLHLSDIHFRSNEPDAPEIWSSQLCEDVLTGLKVKKVDGIIVSGDITVTASEDEYSLALRFFNNISSELKINPDNIFIIPGNHDVDWNVSKDRYKIHRVDEYVVNNNVEFSYINSGYVEILNQTQAQLKFNNFKTFLLNLKSDTFDLKFENQFWFAEINGIEIYGLNSSWRIDHLHPKDSNINNSAFAKMMTFSRSRQTSSRGRKILVLHHPFFSNSDSPISNSDIIEQLSKANFDLILHGHVHMSLNSCYNYDVKSFGSSGRKIEIVAAGTFGAATHEWQPGYPLQYNFLRFNREGVVVETRRREEINGAWKPDARWTKDSDSDPLPRYFIKFFP